MIQSYFISFPKSSDQMLFFPRPSLDISRKTTVLQSRTLSLYVELIVTLVFFPMMFEDKEKYKKLRKEEREEGREGGREEGKEEVESQSPGCFTPESFLRRTDIII